MILAQSATPGLRQQMPRTLNSIFNARLRGPCLDDVRIDQRIDLGYADMGALASAALRPAANELQQPHAQTDRRGGQRNKPAGCGR